MLELKSIKKSYKVGEVKQQVLKGINIKFRKCEFTSILGSSGSGKTTLLNIIGGLDKYDSGDLIIEGTSTKKYNNSNWDSYRNHRVGFIFQSYNLIMHQTVLSNVEIALTLSGIKKQERKKLAIDALTKVGLKEHIYKKPNQLSGGQMQRVAIARALVNNPEIILADEPTGALDSKTSIQIMDILREISKDKLVIMVTHNPELAKEYSNRIIELKDGFIINDTNPYNDEIEENNEKKITKTSMSIMSALTLSLNNLMTKKGRTFLTAFAGSIGIIGIALILSLSNGVNNMAKGLERDSLSDYPISIERTSYDLFGAISMSIEETGKKQECPKGKLCSNDDIVKNSNVSLSKGLMQKNNIKEFAKYINENKDFEKYSASIDYVYNTELQVYTNDYTKVNPSNIKSNNNTDESNNIFNELENQKKYKIIAGKMPSNKNEIALVIGENQKINDSILYSLNIKDKNVLNNDLSNIKKDKNYKVQKTELNYSDILDKTYKLILNTDYYKEENNIFIDYSSDKNYMKEKIDNGEELKIVGIIQDDSTASNYVGYTHDTIINLIDNISMTKLYEKQINNKDINVLTNTEFDGILDTYDELEEKLCIYKKDNPSSIKIYPKDFDSKGKIVNLINDYNKQKEKNKEKDLVINYSDMMKNLVGGITKVINVISFVLIGFVAISLIVSSIMIAIITYISVLERTKEIGILRALGASKKDIKRVFIAETIIEGFIAGTLGVLIAVLLSVPINAIVKVLAKIDNIANMPLMSAIILICLSILLNVIAGLKPANMAARKDPVESLRTE